MPTITLEPKQIAAIFEEEELEGFNYTIADDKDDWTQDGKDQYKVITFELDSKFYQVVYYRQGSPFTDWFYSHQEFPESQICHEVERKEIVVIQWVTVKDN